MKVGAIVHMYVPLHNAGAEHMLHAMLKEMVKRGHSVVVLLDCIDDGYVIDGVRVVNNPALLKDCDVILTHLDKTNVAEKYCSSNGIPLVQVFHNHYRPGMASNCSLAIYNTQWLLDGYSIRKPSIVVHPPIWKDDYLIKKNSRKYITLVNLIPEKGSELFYSIASKMKNTEFLGVIGSYNGNSGKQDIRDLPNVTIMDNQKDIRKVYRQTRILLMPSSYESYGRCAVEASINGIPVIASSTDGLKEALGGSGVFPNSMNVNDWVKAIKKVDKSYDKFSDSARLVLDRLDPEFDMARCIGAIESVVNGFVKHDGNVKNKFLVLGLDVVMDGVFYAKNSKISYDTAYEMKSKGLIVGKNL